jgi:DNA-binding transcriptional LysR family regulator
VAVAEELNFSRAASRLHLTQPPLSRHIKGLEDKLGVPLLKRDTQSVSLTKPGALLLADGRLILRQLDRAAEAVQRAGKGAVDRLEVGFTASTLDNHLSRFLYDFRHAHPGVQLRVRELDAPELLEGLQDLTIDGAFIGNVATELPKGFRLVLWRMTPVWLAVSKDHPLAGQPGVHLRELADQSWIFLSREVAPAYHLQVTRWCQDEGFRPRVVAEPSRSAAMLALIAIGDGIGLVPDQLKSMGAGIPELRFLRLLSPFAVLPQAFVCRDDDDSPVLRDFVALLEQRAEIELQEG